MNKKFAIILISVLAVIAAVLMIVFSKGGKTYDIPAIENFFTRGYQEEGLRVMDFIDVQTMFGMSVADLEEYTFMTNIVDQDENLFDDMLVVLIKSEDDNIFDILSSHIEAKKMNTSVKEEIEFYDTVIIKRNKEYVYLLLGSDTKLLEKELNAYYK